MKKTHTRYRIPIDKYQFKCVLLNERKVITEKLLRKPQPVKVSVPRGAVLISFFKMQMTVNRSPIQISLATHAPSAAGTDLSSRRR